MFVELFQKGVRTVYRTLGARELSLRDGDASMHGFRFDGPEQRPIVFLHGLGDASTTWYRVVRPLREHTTVLALDLPPFGLSDLDERPFLPPQEQAALVARVIEDALEEPVTLVGQSLGGWVAQWIAAQHPDWVDQLVMISPAGVPLPGSLEAVSHLTPGDLDAVLDYFDRLWYDPPPTLELAARSMYERLHTEEIQGFLDAVTEEHLLSRETMADIDVPALVVWGAHDRLLDPRTPAYLAQHWGAPVERTYLARAGHMPHLERPHALRRRLMDVAGLP